MNPFENDPNEVPSKNTVTRNTPAGSQDLQVQIKMSMDRQLQGTTRCLSSIHESQAVGYATAEELVEQGEKLDRAEGNIDKILQDTRQSQRHLNSIKSVFGGIKNWWKGNDSNTPTTAVETKNRTSRPLDVVLDGHRSATDSHPILNKKADTLGFYDDDVKDFNDFDPDSFTQSSRTATVVTPQATKATTTATTTTTPKQPSRNEVWNNYEQGMDNNLSQMSNGLSSLKMLAQGMNEEIETQNSQLERITDKADRSDTKVRSQNLQMKRILGK